MKNVWVNKTDSFSKAEEFDRYYYLRMTATKRLEIVQLLREAFFKIKKRLKNENRKGLRRVIKVIQ